MVEPTVSRHHRDRDTTCAHDSKGHDPEDTGNTFSIPNLPLPPHKPSVPDPRCQSYYLLYPGLGLYPVFNNRYNTWTLLGSLTIIMGTYQQNLLRNSIFAMMFLPLMVWLWKIATKSRNLKWLLLYPVILLLWTHMHGYAIVGLSILALFFVGEVIDQCIKKDYRNIRFLLVLLIVLGCSWKIVHVNWNVNPLGIVSNIQATILQNDSPKTTPAETIIKKPEISQKTAEIDDSPDSQVIRIVNLAQKLFRPA